MSQYSVRKPITVLMGILIVIVLGIYSVNKLPLSLFPDINLPYIVTVTTYPGENPETLEQEVTQKIESSVQTIGNFKEVQSMSYENFAISIITFADQTNMDSVVIELRENLNNIAFSEGISSPRILRISPDMLPVMSVTISKSYDEVLSDEEILIRNTQWIYSDILTELNSIPGIAEVSVSGAADVVLQINLDQQLLINHGLSTNAVLSIIENQNTSGLIGVGLDDGEIRLVYLGQRISNLDEVKNLPIVFDGLDIIYLKDLVVEDGIRYVDASSDSYSKINGQQGVQIFFQKQSDVGITEATENIYAKLDELLEGYPNAEYRVLLDQGDYINQSIGSVLQNLIIGGIFAIFILFIFLKDLKPTIIVGLAIPISVIAAFMLMFFANVSLNIVSLGGLALGIGMLVDNAVVVIENIYRMLNEGKSKKEAATEGARQVAGAITASTLTTMAVFLPIVFIEGMISEVFMSMALTIAFSLGASLIIALTLVPSMSAKFLNETKHKKDGRVIQRLKQWYEVSVLFVLKHKIKSLVVILLLLVTSFILVSSKGFVLLPASDEGVINVTLQTKSQTTFDAKAELADYITERIMNLDDIETVSGRIGSSGMFAMMGGMRSSGGDQITITINLTDDRSLSTQAYEDKVLRIIETINYQGLLMFEEEDLVDYQVSAQNSTFALAGTSGVNIKVSGYDLNTLEMIANDLTVILEGVDHLEDISNGINQGADQIRIDVNRINAMKNGFTNQSVQDNLSYFYSNLEVLSAGETISVRIDGIEYDIDIPTTSFGNIDFSNFGDYQLFFSGVQLFDEATLMMIDEYIENNQLSIADLNTVYTFNMVLPTYTPGDPIVFIVNPFLKINDQNKIVYNPMDMVSPSLSSLSVAPLYDLSNPDDSITTIVKQTGFASINTDGTNRFLNVTAQVERGYNVTLVSRDVVDAVNQYIENDLPNYGSGYMVTLEGENEEIYQALGDLSLAAIVAILLVFMVMAIQFQSLLYPLIILVTIPLAFTGGLFALLIANMNLSMVSLMGFIILIGVVVNNGIVLIDYINKLRAQGLTIKEAIVQAGKTRLRPILMTALTTVLALFMTALGVGEGAELLQPMAVTAIGGLIYATILTLVIVPLIYALMNHRTMKKEGMIDANNEG